MPAILTVDDSRAVRTIVGKQVKELGFDVLGLEDGVQVGPAGALVLAQDPGDGVHDRREADPAVVEGVHRLLVGGVEHRGGARP